MMATASALLALTLAAPRIEINARAGGQFGGDIQDGDRSVSMEVGLTEWLYVRAQVDLRLAFLGGGSLFCGTTASGGGCLVAVRDVYAQGNASGGLAVKF